MNAQVSLRKVERGIIFLAHRNSRPGRFLPLCHFFYSKKLSKKKDWILNLAI